jgi:hypothetical protein
MGKTSLLQALQSGGRAAWCTARQLINRHDPRTILGDRQLLLIDALDEVATGAQGDAVDLVLRKLGELDYPRFVLSCRVADWRAATMVEAITEQYGAAPLELHLHPLNRDQQLQLLAMKTDESRANTLLAHFEKFDLDFLGNPQTLELVAALPISADLPETSSALFAMATEQLRREHKEGKPELPSDTALDAAGAAFAALLLTGSSSIVRKASANIYEGELLFTEVAALAGGTLERVVDTKLFRATSESFTYWHRRIGEFLAARWLAARADTSAKRRRLLTLLRSEGRVPANLRGLHAWLALDSELAPDVIATDPMGVIEYGDADALTAAQAKLLLDALDQLSRDNPWFVGWNDYRAASLLASPLQDEVCAAIADRSREFGLRKLLLQQLHIASLQPKMREVLLALLRDPSEYYAIRELAGEILAGGDGIDWPTELEEIRSQGNRTSTRLAFELMGNVGFATFDDIQIVETVLAYDGLSLCPVPKAAEDNMVARYWKLVGALSQERYDGVLDLFSQYIEALLPRHAGIDEHDFLDMYYELILARLARGAVEPTRLWAWLMHVDDQHSYKRDRRDQLSEWFRSNPEVRRAIQELVLLPVRDPSVFRAKAFDLPGASPGLSIDHADALVLLDRLNPNDSTDERWREVLWFVRSSGDEGKDLREAAKRFAAHRPDLLEWIDNLADPSEPEWKLKQDDEARKRRAERAATHADHRRDYVTHLEAIRGGEFRFVRNLAGAYLKHFRDIGDDMPAHERIADWVGPDVAEVAHQGFEAFLQIVPPRPNAVRIAIGHAKGTRWYASDIIVAALAERLRTREAPFEGVPSERLMAGLFEIWRTRIDSHAGIEGLQSAIETKLRGRGEFECAVRLYIEPQLKKRATHVDHLYALMRSEEYGADLRILLAEDWLHRFPLLHAEAESEMIDALIANGSREVLVELISDRLSRKLDDERRRNWDAVQLIVDFEAARARLECQVIEPTLLWHLRARGSNRQRDDRGSADLKPSQIEWIVTTFRKLYPNCGHSSGDRIGDTNPWNATEYLSGLVARLGNDVSDAAVAAMDRLRGAPADGYTDVFKNYSAEQRQARAEHHYVPPTLAQVRTVVEAGLPGSASDLQAVLLDALADVQLRLKGDPLDWYKNFFLPNGRHKNEEPCRDALLQMLDGRIPDVELRPEDHAADDKRVDIVAQLTPQVIVPIEVKGQWHPDLWKAADQQLDHKYVNDWRAERGIYLVLWFGNGTKLKSPPEGVDKPECPEDLQAALSKTSKAVQQGRIKVVILDFTRPVST